MHRGTSGSLSRMPTTSGALIPGSRRFTSSLLGRGRVARLDHKTCSSMAEACSGLQPQRLERLGGLIPVPVPLASGLSRPAPPEVLHFRSVSRSCPLDGSGLVQSANRSEEHTSELQSRENLVCRLL